MIDNLSFLNLLKEHGVTFFSGVPDSLLKQICACITDQLHEDQHVIAANEGAAVALASGYHLATGQLPLVYLQNSGLGNTINPLLSLAAQDVYSLPMVLMIGWRGEPGVKDEPQHIKQGKVQNALLEVMGIPFEILDTDSNDYAEKVSALIDLAKRESRPVAIIIRKGTFADYAISSKNHGNYEMKREEALEVVVDQLDDKDIIVSTTGMPSREIFEIRARNKMGHHCDFLTVGSMGHCSQIAMGIAMQKPDRHVYCIDGDGSVIMHMGSLAINGFKKKNNFKHVVLNNGAHDSVGGQPTVGFSIDIPAIAKANGYIEAYSVSTKDELEKAMKWLSSAQGPVMLEVKVAKGARKDLGRPTRSPQENKTDLMKNLQS